MFRRRTLLKVKNMYVFRNCGEKNPTISTNLDWRGTINEKKKKLLHVVDKLQNGENFMKNMIFFWQFPNFSKHICTFWSNFSIFFIFMHKVVPKFGQKAKNVKIRKKGVLFCLPHNAWGGGGRLLLGLFISGGGAKTLGGQIFTGGH